MALNISLRSSQFGNTQLTSDHFATSAYATFVVSSVNVSLADGAVANINDLAALETTIQGAIDSDIDARLGSLVSILGAGITYDATNDTFAFGTINLTSSAASPTPTDWTEVIEAIDGAVTSNETSINTNTVNIGTLTGTVGGHTTSIGNLETEMTATQLGAGLNTDGSYIVPTTGNISGASSLANADSLLDSAITSLSATVAGLGAAFNYVNATSIDPQSVATNPSTDPNATGAVRASWAAGNQFQDLSLLTEKDTGDYYKANSSGWISFDGTAGNTVWVNQYDGVVWNSTNSIDKIDNTNADIQDSGDLSVTGSSDAGWVISSSVIDVKVSSNTTSIGTNTTNIGTNAGNIGTNTTNIGTNTTNIATNTSDISDLETEMTATQTSVGVNADGSLPNYANNNNIVNTESHHVSIGKLDAAVQQSSIAPVDTGRLTVAPVSHQYAAIARLNDVNDLKAYASEVYDADATNTSGTNIGVAGAGAGSGDLHEFRVPTSASGIAQILVLGSLLADAPTPTIPANSGASSHLNNNTYWSSVRVYKNGVRLIQRNSSATLQSADEYKVVAVVNPANYPATWGDYDSSDEFVRYPIKYGSKVESAWRAAVTTLNAGATDTGVGQSHTLAGQTNTDVNPTTAHPLANTVHPNAGLIRYYKIEFGAVLDTQDIMTVDYMGLKD